MLTGSPDVVREQAALGIGELIEATAPQDIKAFVPQLAGPLIRIIGDRFPWQVNPDPSTLTLATLILLALTLSETLTLSENLSLD